MDLLSPVQQGADGVRGLKGSKGEKVRSQSHTIQVITNKLLKCQKNHTAEVVREKTSVIKNTITEKSNQLVTSPVCS